ncbi:auxin-responsive protein IAA26-like isoform X2 [Curcuma longa]
MDEDFNNRGRPQLLPYERDLELRLGLPRGEDNPRAISTFKGPQLKQQVGFLQLQSMEVLNDEAHFASGSAYDSLTSRTATVLAVGWPPLSSFRKNLASSSHRPPIESENEDVAAPKVEDPGNSKKNLLVKINMDGVPIGRKVDLYVYDSYEKLSLAVEELFAGLLAGNPHSEAAKQMSRGLLDGTGEYTLVYEDNEGDRMLVGDAPWNMFTSAIKRLRVMKTSDMSALEFKSTYHQMSMMQK